jgi:hypothetical protein
MYHDGQYPQQQQMSQYTKSGGTPSILSSASAYPPTSEAYGPSSSAGGTGLTIRMNKQQEAAQAYAQSHPRYSGGPDSVPMSSAVSGTGLTGLDGPRGLSVINPDEQIGRGSSVVQHRDGGRVRMPMTHENDAEVPPSYDSIPPGDLDDEPVTTPRAQ